MASNTRKKRPWVSMLTLLDDIHLQEMGVKVIRKGIPEPDVRTELLRQIDDPFIVAKLVHYRTDEESCPIFSRDDIIVNQEEIIEERVVTTDCHKNKSTPKELSRNTSQSRSSKASECNKKPDQRPKSPVPHDSKRYASGSSDPDYYLEETKRGRSSSSKSYENHPQSRNSHQPRRKLSRTPPRSSRDRKSRSPCDYRSNKSSFRYKSWEKARSPGKGKGRHMSRSPGRRNTRYGSRSPHPKHREERRRSRESREVRKRPSHSRSRSPYRGDSRRSSRSPHKSYRSYSSKHRSRSRSLKPPPHDHDLARLHDFQFYKAKQYWYPGAIQSPFLAPGFIPPGAFPRLPGPVIMPRMPMMRQTRAYRPRLPVYNRPKVRTAHALRPAPSPSASSTSAPSTVMASSVITSTQNVEPDVVSSCDLHQETS